MDAEDLRDERGELDLEISDMRPEPAADGKRVPWHLRRVELPRPLLAAMIAGLVVLALLVMLSASGQFAALVARPAPTANAAHVIFPTAVPTPLPTTTPYPTPTLIAPPIGSVPADCPPGTTLVPFDPAATDPGIGTSDMWLYANFEGPRAVFHLGSSQPNIYTPYGWQVQIMALVKPGFTQLITLTGGDQRTDYPLWLAPAPNVQALPNVTFDPTQLASSTSGGTWRIWFGVLYLPGAGCYTLQARWPGGGWTASFAAGE